jgi:hypothetical protein
MNTSLRGLAHVRLPPGAKVAAPSSGVYLGTTATARPLILRLFRATGTRLTAVSTLVPVQLLAIRAAGAGVLVRVITSRPLQWQPLLVHGADARAVPPGSELPAATGASLVIDDRPDEVGRARECGPWSARIDLRSPANLGDPRALAHADALLLGAVAPQLALAATTAFSITVAHLSELTSPGAGTVTLVRRGAVDQVALDPTAEEVRLLQQAGS